MNRRNEEYKKYINLYNTLAETKRIVNEQLEYILEAKDGYKNSKAKKDKEKFRKTLTEIVAIVNNGGTKAKHLVDKLKQDKVRKYNNLINRKKHRSNLS